MHFDQVTGSAKEEHLEQIMAAHGNSLLRMCFLYLQDEELARDAVQETFLKAYRKLETFRGASSELTWLTRIAINTCRDMHRTSWFRMVDRKTPLDELPEQSYVQAFRDDTVLQTVTKLPERYRVVVLLHYYQGMTQAEMARALSLPLSTVKTRLARAKGRLKTSLKGWVEG